MTLSVRLRQAMNDAGITQAELARSCGVRAPSVHGWLSGKSKFLRGENLLRAAMVLDVSDQWLATGRGSQARNHQGVADTGSDYSGDVPIDPDIVFEVARALHNVHDELGLTYNFTENPQLFITAYQRAGSFDNYRAGRGNAWIGSQIKTVAPEGNAADERGKDAHAGSMHKKRTGGSAKKG